MDDTPEIFRALLRIVQGVLRIANFIASELKVREIGWVIGWCFFRGLSFGYFPRESIKALYSAGWLTALVVEFTGLALLGVVILMLSAAIG